MRSANFPPCLFRPFPRPRRAPPRVNASPCSAPHLTLPHRIALVAGNTPLHLACDRGLVGNVKLLLEWGADADARNETGAVPAEVSPAQLGDERVSNHRLFFSFPVFPLLGGPVRLSSSCTAESGRRCGCKCRRIALHRCAVPITWCHTAID